MKYLKKTFSILILFFLVILLMINVMPVFMFESDEEIIKDLRTYAPNAVIDYQTTSYGALRYVMTDSSKSEMLLMVHGAPGDWSNYEQYLKDKELGAKFNIVSVDRIGYGQSSSGESKTSIVEQAFAIQKVVESLSPKELTVVGHSYGGPIAAYLSTLNDQSCRKVIMVAPVNNPHTEQIKWYAYLSKGLSWGLPDMIDVATEEKFNHVEALKEVNGIWETIQCPITHIHGTQDELADCESNIDFSIENISPSLLTVRKLNDEGHLLIWEKYNLIKKEISSN